MGKLDIITIQLIVVLLVIFVCHFIDGVPLRCTVDPSRKTVDCSARALETTILLVNKGDAQKIESINYADNTIEEIEGLNRFPNVSKLDFPRNLIRNISTDAFSALSKLEYLDLSYNNIHYLDMYLFIKNKKLTRLSLEGNRLDIHSDKPIVCSASLTVLNLSTCTLLTITRENLLCVPSLMELDISANALTTLTPEMFSPLNKLVSINLGTNRFHCDCKLPVLLNWARTKKTDVAADSSDPLYCVVPGNRGRREYREIEKSLNCSTDTNVVVSPSTKSQNENSSSEFYDYILITYDTSVQPADGHVSLRYMGLISNKLYTIEALLSLVLFLLVVITGMLFCRHYRTVGDVSDNMSEYSVYDHFVSDKLSTQLIQKSPKDHMYAHIK